MSSFAIKVENLSKQYRIGTREAYMTFRETLLNSTKAPFRRLKNFGKSTPKEGIIWALRDVSFEVKQGDVLGIIGRNGAGKTTLLKIFSRITEPTKGRVMLKGRVASLLEVGTGFHPELTGKENIYLNGAILGMKRHEISKKFDEIVAFAEVEKFLDTPVKRYSSGMYMRLAFAVAAHLEPEILLVDEVLAVGDATFKKKCLNKMNDVSNQGRTVLFVSHNMGAVQTLCQNVIWVHEGKIVQTGLSAEVIGEYLSFGTNNDGKINWSSEDAPGDEAVKLKSVRLLNARGKVCSNFRADEEILTEIEYEVRQKITGMRLNFSLLTQSGELAFASTSHFLTQKTQKPGQYIVKCKIPPNLLNLKKYYVEISSGIPGVKTLWNPMSCVSFQIDGIGNQGSAFPENWPGVICPKIDWEIRYL